MTLAEQVLDEIAKTYKRHKIKGGGGGWDTFKNFAEMEEHYSGTNPYYPNRIKRTVELALLAKQAEVLKEIDILLADSDFQDDMVLGELKKRLLTKVKE